jgi:hypothetical protein
MHEPTVWLMHGLLSQPLVHFNRRGRRHGAVTVNCTNDVHDTGSTPMFVIDTDSYADVRVFKYSLIFEGSWKCSDSDRRNADFKSLSRNSFWFSFYLLYWYKSTNTDTQGDASACGRRAGQIHGGPRYVCARAHTHTFDPRRLSLIQWRNRVNLTGTHKHVRWWTVASWCDATDWRLVLMVSTWNWRKESMDSYSEFITLYISPRNNGVHELVNGWVHKWRSSGLPRMSCPIETQCKTEFIFILTTAKNFGRQVTWRPSFFEDYPCCIQHFRFGSA